MKNLIIIIGMLFWFQSANSQQIYQEWLDSIDLFHDNDNAVDLLLSSDNNLYVLGNSVTSEGSSILLANYNDLGSNNWLKTLHIENGCYANNFILCNYSSLYVVGAVNDFSINSKGFIAKFDLNGDTLWTRIIEHALNREVYFNSVVCDEDGNVIVGGNSIIDSNSYHMDYIILKLNSSGDSLWTYIKTGDQDNQLYKVALDSESNVIVVGDDCTFKLDTNGNMLWESEFGGWDCVLDSLNNIYVTDKFLTACLSTNGDTLWSHQLIGSPIFHYSKSLVLTHNHELLVAGSSNVGDNDDNIFVIVYDSLGDSSLVIEYTSDTTPNGNSIDRVSNITIDQDNHIYLIGSSKGAVVLKFHHNGNLLWKHNYRSSDSLSDGGTSLCLDLSGNVYTVGNSQTITSFYWYDIIVQKISQNICCIDFAGNIDNDLLDNIDIADLVFFVDFSFNGGTEPFCFEEADVDGTKSLDIGDIVYIVDYMFGSPQGPLPIKCLY
ncbi:MAG: hypothetical protein DWP97_03720 [Calditrichaeota bacterium]|nr:MAG: hypothetical protein DWP97_03720 [Calditrichota bacterium]